MFFLIVGLIPHLNELLPYKLCLVFPEANAAEEQAPEAQADKAAEGVEGEVTDQEAPSSKESASSDSMTSMILTDKGSSGVASSVSFEVDDFTGAAHLKYPILVPPGRDGLVPILSLNYNSSSPNGWIGVGWDISAGFVERRGARKGVPKYDSSDVFVLNLGGSPQELVSIGGGEYRLRIEGPNYKIQYDSTNNYWKVWDKSGVKMRFGSSPDSRIDRQTYGLGTFRWCIDRVDDPKTNYMEFVYQKDLDGTYVNQLYLQKIQYNGQVSGNLPHNHEITFNLDPSFRTDPIYNFRGGFKSLTRKRLSSVEIRTNDNLVRTYQLQYTILNVKSLLSLITVYGSDNTSTLPPTTFTYQTHTLGFQQQGTLWSNPAASGIINGNYIRNTDSNGVSTNVIDMNGDGLLDRVKKNDACQYPFTNCDWSVYPNNGTGFDTSPVSWPNPSAWHPTDGNYIQNSNTNGAYTDVIDMNADGLPDRVVYNRSCAYPYTNCPWKVYFNNGTGFNAGVDWPNPSPWDNTRGNYIRNTDSNGVSTNVIDMNGDGLPDRVVYNRSCAYPYTNCPWKVYFNNGTGFNAGVDWPNPSAWHPTDGNNIQNSNTNGAYTDVIDMNGDGLPDRIVYNRSCAYPYTNCPWKVYFNNGTGFGAGVDWPNPSAWHPTDGNNIQNSNTNGAFTDVIDMDADGLPDRVVYDRTYPYTQWSVYFNKGPVPALLSNVENGIGGTIGFTYLSSTAYQNNHLPFNVNTVSSVSVDDGNGVISTTNYTYSGGYFSAADREFRGFEYVKQTKPDQSTLETWYYQDKTGDPLDSQCTGCRGKPYEQHAKDLSGNLYTKTYYFYTPASPYPGVTSPALTGKDDLVYDGTSTCKRSAISYEYDPYGNIKRTYYHGEVVPETGEEIPGDERDDNTNHSCVNDSTQYVCRPSTTFAKDSAGATKAQTWFTYYIKNGLITKDLLTKEEWHSGCITPPCTNPITNYGYDNYGNQTSITDPEGNTTTIEFDTVTYTYPVKITTPHLNFYTRKTYDYRHGTVLTDRDYNGNISTYTYDPFGRTKTVLQPPDTGVPPTKEYFYENFGTVGSQKVRLLLRIDSTHQTWNETYFDGLGRTFLTKKEGLLPGKAICTATEYSDRGLVVGRSLPYFEDAQNSYWTEFEYDVMERQTKVTPPDGKFTTISYDKRRTTIIDANKHAKVQEKDPYGRLVKVEEYEGTGTPESPYQLYATTTYQYDVLNNLVKVIDAAGNQTTIAYDTLSRKVSMTDPDMCFSQNPNTCKWTYKYDANGNLTEQTDAKGKTILFSYYNPAIGRSDPLNRVMKKDYSTGTDIVYTYDQAGYDNPKGRLTSVTDSSGMTENFYDERGRIKKTIKTVDSVNYPMETTYDSLDRIKSIKYPDQEIVSYTYNTAGNLSGVSGAANYATYVEYNALGQPINVQYGNGVATAYAYDPYTNRPTSILTNRSGLPLQNLSYLYDDIGNVKTITDALDPTRTQTFQYDHLNRLTQADSQAYPSYPQPITYQYNQIGNMTYNSQVGSYVYPNPGSPRPHAVTQAGSNTYTYDNNGNMIGGGGRTIAYDYDNRPSSITQSGVIGFVYDYQGQRVKKSGPSSTTYIGKLYEITAGVNTKYIFSGTKRIVSKTTSATNYYHTDHLGSSNVITNTSGTMVEEIYYFPYGATRLDSGSVDVKHKYTGQEEDPETGLYYYGARYYDPVLARFISPDTIVPEYTNPQSLNRYSYVLNNPLFYVDPSGMEWEPAFDDWSGTAMGYLWVPPEESYTDDNGTLREGLYHQAIFFTETGTFSPFSSYNIGSSIAYVYKADGTIETFRATTYPSDLYKYATIPEGTYEAVVGLHKNSYMALRMSDVGTTDRRIELGTSNPAYTDGRTFVEWANIHQAGKYNFTGNFTAPDGSLRPISTACPVTDVNRWDSFISIFDNPQQRENIVSVTISATYAVPINIYGIGGPLLTIDSRTISSIYR
jgi:RHS repeat-associated protein